MTSKVYVIFMGWVHHAFYATEAGAREYVRKYIEDYHNQNWIEVSKNRWEWGDFVISVEERTLYV